MVFVSGQRTKVSAIEAGAAVAAQEPRAEDNFTLHKFWPADFLLVCGSRRVRDDVVAAGVVDGRGFLLRFSPWNRQLQAVRQSLRFRAHIELTGIPAHAWNRSTVTVLLGSAAWIERLGASTANREDLGSFQVVAWLDSVDRLAREKALLIEEPNDLMEEDEGLVLPGDALIPLEKLMLRYVIRIRLMRAEDMTVDGYLPRHGDDRGGDGFGDSSDDGDGHGGRPDRGDGGHSGDDGRSGGLGRPSGERTDSRGAWHRPHASRTEEGQHRRPSAGDWGGCHRIAIDSPLEVTPWPEVAGEDDEEEDDVKEGGACQEERLPAGRETLLQAHAADPPFDRLPLDQLPFGEGRGPPIFEPALGDRRGDPEGVVTPRRNARDARGGQVAGGERDPVANGSIAWMLWLGECACACLVRGGPLRCL